MNDIRAAAEPWFRDTQQSVGRSEEAMGRQEATRRENLIRLLDLTRRRGPLAQVELARETGLRPSTVSYLARTLREAGVVTETGRGASGPAGGKRSVYLAIDPGFGCFTGALLRGRELITAMVDFAGTAHQWQRETLSDQSPEALYRRFEKAARSHGETARKLGSGYLGLGAAVSSVVDKEGAVHSSAAFPYVLEELPKRLEEAASSAGAENPAVVVENDANCTALYHHQRTSEPPGSVVSLVFARDPVSVGAGLILSGALYRGRSGGAGEILPADFGEDPEEMDRLAAAAVRVTDPEVVVLAAEEGDPALLPGEYPRLYRELRSREVVRVSNPEASVLGAAYLAYEKSLRSLVLPRSAS
ncbi:MAG: helix-turn-helix domain-containing protein [Alkalispirochaetaceae bacterium]